MNIGLLSILHNKIWDFRPDMAQTYANALKNAIELQLDNDIEKQHGYFLSKKGYKDKDGRTVGANFEDKLYVGNIYRVENHLYWNDEELADDDQIIDVVVVDGPITRDGGGCSYGSKDWRDQVLYANTIPQVVGHLFIVNTPGGEAAARNDYEMMINDCREKGKPTVAFVDGMCASSGVNLACRCDRVLVMNPKDEFGCIGTMAAFWAVAHDTVDQDGYRYVELVGKDCPEKNAWWREAAKGEYEKLQADLDKDTVEFHQTVRENRPLVTDDMLSGKVFEAQEVIPALVDEIGDMERAIECVFALANEEMQAARFMTAPDPDGEGVEPEPGNEPEELAKLSEQQKAAINKEKGNLTVVDNGHVSAERQGMFGPHMEEIATPKNDKEMTDEEKKAQEAAAAQAAEKNEEAAQAEAQGAEAPAAGGTDEGTQEGAGNGSGEGAGTEGAGTEGAGTEGTGEGTQEGAGEGTEEGAGTEGTGEGAYSEGAGEGTDEGTGEGAGSGEGAGEEKSPAAQPSDKTIEEAQANIDKIQETLHNAEQMIADKDKEIESLKAAAGQKEIDFKAKDETIATLTKERDDANSQLSTLNSQLSEKDATIETLTKQVADLQAEVKELAGKPGSMTNEQAGIPAGNGTGDAPKVHQKRITRENMTYEHCREVAKERQAQK